MRLLGHAATAVQALGQVSAILSLAACGSAPGAPRRIESDAELQARDERDFANSPDMKLPELRQHLIALGVTNKEIRETTEENGVSIFKLTLDDAKFDRLDKVALAGLELDSRYRFRLDDSAQVTKFAHFSVAENDQRKKARSLRELAANGEIDDFPRYSDGVPMIGYARALEHYCGYQPGEALNVIEGRWLEYRHRMVDKAVEDRDGRKNARASFDCVVRIVYATELQPHFIGNRSPPGTTKI